MSDKTPFMCELCNENHGPFGASCKNRLIETARALRRDNTEPVEPRSADGSLSIETNSSKEFERQLLAILGANNVQVPMTGNTITAILAAHHKATQELVRAAEKYAIRVVGDILESEHGFDPRKAMAIRIEAERRLESKDE